MARALASLLFAALSPAAVADEVVVGLIGIQTSKPFHLQKRAGQALTVRVATRIPTARYRVTIEKTGASTERYEPLPPPGSFVHRPAGPGACQALDTLVQQLFNADTERAAFEKATELFAAEVSPSCAHVKASIAVAREFMDFKVPRIYVLALGESLKVMVERLSSDGRTVLRAWNVHVEPPSLPPDLGWTYRTEEAWLVAEIARDIAEMLIYAKDRSLPDQQDLAFAAAEIAGSGASAYRVAARIGSRPDLLSLPLQIEEHVWSPITYTPWQAQFWTGCSSRPHPPAGLPRLWARFWSFEPRSSNEGTSGSLTGWSEACSRPKPTSRPQCSSGRSRFARQRETSTTRGVPYPG